MDAVRRIREASAVREPPLSAKTGSVSAPSAAEYSDSGDGEAEAGPSGTSGSTPWYRVSRRDYPKSKSGYELSRFSVVSPVLRDMDG
jgi:hypothetical protein